MNAGRLPIVILGAGPAGLAAAAQLARRRRFQVAVVERNPTVGGNAASFVLDGQPVDYGSHRLHPACPPDVLADIRAMLGADLLDRPRHGRIRLSGRWLHFPLKPFDLAAHLPPSFVFGLARDAARKAIGLGLPGGGDADSFAGVLERGLGRTICREFYFPYAEKIWGLPASEIDAEQARRRVSAGSIAGMVKKVLAAVPGVKPAGAGRFFYPKSGYGQISGAYSRAACAAGADIRLNATATAVELDAGRVTAVLVRHGSEESRLTAALALSTIPLPILVRLTTPSAPADVLAAAGALKYRAMILIYLVLQTDRFSEYDAHYFPERQVPISRVSEPKNYGLNGRPGTTVLCAELPCATDDPVWKADDQELGRLASAALARAGLPIHAPVGRVATRRLNEAYPVYARRYREHFDRLDSWAAGIDGLLTFGRQGLFVHDNTHHTLAMAYAAAACLDDDGRLDRARWQSYRQSFAQHVVED